MSFNQFLAHPRRWKLLVATLLVGWMLGVGTPARATCTYAAPTTGSSASFNVIGGNIMSGRDLPIGSLLGRSRTTMTTSVGISCTTGTYMLRRLLLTAPYPRSAYQPPNYGGNVFDTPIPGVGVVFLTNGGASFPGDNNPAPHDATTTIYYDGSFATTSISFIKTAANVGTGVIRAQDLPTFEIALADDNGQRLLQIFSMTFTGQVAVASRTCRTPDVTRDLGAHNLNELGQVGATTSWVDVPVDLLDCPAFFGSYQSSHNGDDGSTTFAQTNNVINYRIDPLTPALDASQGIMSLATGGATGIGVQLADSNLQPVPLAQVRPSNISVGVVENAKYTLGLKARYVQTGQTPTAGAANTSATLTFVYL